MVEIYFNNILVLNSNKLDVISNNIVKYLNQTNVTNAIHTYGISLWKSSDETSAPNPDALKCDIAYNNSATLIFYNGQFDVFCFFDVLCMWLILCCSLSCVIISISDV